MRDAAVEFQKRAIPPNRASESRPEAPLGQKQKLKALSLKKFLKLSQLCPRSRRDATSRHSAARVPCRCRKLGATGMTGRQNQSHQRNSGNNSPRTLWFEGFLFASLPGKTTQLFPCVPTGRYNGVLGGTGIIRPCGNNSQFGSPEGRFRADETDLKLRGGFKPSSIAFAQVNNGNKRKCEKSVSAVFSDPECRRITPCILSVLLALLHYFPQCKHGINRSHTSHQRHRLFPKGALHICAGEGARRRAVRALEAGRARQHREAREGRLPHGRLAEHAGGGRPRGLTVDRPGEAPRRHGGDGCMALRHRRGQPLALRVLHAREKAD